MKENSLEFASYHSEVSWVLLTNQRAVFHQGIATLFKNLFMTLAPTILKDLEREHFGVCTLNHFKVETFRDLRVCNEDSRVGNRARLIHKIVFRNLPKVEEGVENEWRFGWINLEASDTYSAN